MWVIFVTIWAILHWGFDTGYGMKMVSPTEGAPTLVLGVPVNILYILFTTLLLIGAPAWFMYRLDLTRVETPETERDFRTGPAAGREE